MKNYVSSFAAIILACTCILSGCNRSPAENEISTHEEELTKNDKESMTAVESSGRKIDANTGAYLLSSLTPDDYPEYIDSTDMFDSRLAPQTHAAESVSFWSAVDSRYHTIAADAVPGSTIDELAEMLASLSEWCTLSSPIFDDGEQMYTNLDAIFIKEKIAGYAFGVIENYVDIRICPNTGDYEYFEEIMKVRIYKNYQSGALTYNFWFSSADINYNLGTEEEPLYSMYVTFPECSIIPDSIYAPCTLVYIAYEAELSVD